MIKKNWILVSVIIIILCYMVIHCYKSSKAIKILLAYNVTISPIKNKTDLMCYNIKLFFTIVLPLSSMPHQSINALLQTKNHLQVNDKIDSLRSSIVQWIAFNTVKEKKNVYTSIVNLDLFIRFLKVKYSKSYFDKQSLLC